jgi:hypothetical protein
MTEAKNDNLEESIFDSMKEAFDSGRPQRLSEVWGESYFTIFDITDASASNRFWSCDVEHEYAIGTSEANADINNLRLWNNDILFGFKASDTSGYWNTDMRYNSTHKVRLSISHINSRGVTKRDVHNYDHMAGDRTTGNRYFAFFPSEIGRYTVTINRVISAGNCEIPNEGNNNFYQFSFDIKPPLETDDYALGFDIDYDALKVEYKDLITTLNNLGAEPVSPVSPVRLFGIATVVSLLGYWMFSSIK